MKIRCTLRAKQTTALARNSRQHEVAFVRVMVETRGSSRTQSRSECSHVRWKRENERLEAAMGSMRKRRHRVRQAALRRKRSALVALVKSGGEPYVGWKNGDDWKVAEAAGATFVRATLVPPSASEFDRGTIRQTFRWHVASCSIGGAAYRAADQLRVDAEATYCGAASRDAA